MRAAETLGRFKKLARGAPHLAPTVESLELNPANPQAVLLGRPRKEGYSWRLWPAVDGQGSLATSSAFSGFPGMDFSPPSTRSYVDWIGFRRLAGTPS